MVFTDGVARHEPAAAMEAGVAAPSAPDECDDKQIVYGLSVGGRAHESAASCLRVLCVCVGQSNPPGGSLHVLPQ